MNNTKMDNNRIKDSDKPLVLIVDDVPKNLQVLGNILRKKEYNIAAATSGKQALDMVEKVLPDLILLDIMMPDIDGLEVCGKLKKSPRAKDIPVIFLTAKTTTEDIVKGFEVGAVDYLTKPFNSLELLARAQTHIELKRSRDKERELIVKLRDALTKVKQLSGLIPICSRCKKIRDDEGYWQRVEEYLETHSEAQLTHSLCPECVIKLFPEMSNEILEDAEENSRP
ncbi:MAG: response regulator [Candidatus Aminicenantes bacterium]|nr:response regulator [Candidatus Aminicenantes bacterium]